METPWTAGPVWSLAVLIAAAGIVKLGRPSSAVQALRAAALPAPELGVRLLGAAEILLAVWVVVEGSVAAVAALALMQLAFALFSARLLTVQGGRVSCGCFGEASAPTSPLHVGVNLVGAAIAVAAIAWPPGPVTDVLSGQPVLGLAYLALVGVAAWCWYALLVLLPDLLDGISELSSTSSSGAEATR